MGIESDQLVFDYLSRVGDLAQQQGLPAATRMRLVTRLRAEIDERKPDSVSGVKRMLARLGSPEAVVAEAGGTTPSGELSGDGPTARAGHSSGAGHLSRAGEPPSRRTSPRDKLAGLAWRSGLTGKALRYGKASTDDKPQTSGLPPHLAGADELGDGGGAPDWWRMGPAPLGPGETVPGFVGGIEIPEMWDRPDGKGTGKGTGEDGGEGEGQGESGEGCTGGKGSGGDGGRLSLSKRDESGEGGKGGKRATGRAAGGRRGAAVDAEDAVAAADVADMTDVADGSGETGDTGGTGEETGEEVEPGVREDTAGPMPLRAWLSPVPTLAALLLVAGAVLGSWWAVAGGWALAYVSRRLSRTEAKFAALGVPGIVVGGLLVWLWGRLDRRWGEPVAEGRLGQELLDGLPVVARFAAIASALFLLWRMRRAAR
ncbi:hypothetical protein SSP35_01_01480 [Streptomyces sp. NBRC 110611]|uniref:hypothetical protein n=1 Tax=Streptomyces sp. NBRC 110611 TaxID=1621259 RepID=UPI000835A6CA|nr:hypothetical protein [Streptomyces sp. NBRC 110611]GAU64812.1 hypothetical protein SSP35_01_01480 [Streptomyces sp. NBRC 110611]